MRRLAIAASVLGAALSAGCGAKEQAITCPAGMVFVPGGKFVYGARDVTGHKAQEELTGFCIDIYEFPNRAGARPETGASWLEAAAKCRGLGKRLCTEYEWEKACRGSRGLLYPWGNSFDPTACAMDMEAVASHVSGARPRCVSPYGVYDMVGSVWEWTENTWGDDPSKRVVRGGWEASLGELGASCAYRGAHEASQGTPRIGWRCCASPAPPVRIPSYDPSR